MKKTNTTLLFALLIAITGWAQGQLQPFNDDVESHADFAQNNILGWTSVDVDGLNTAGPFQSFPGKGDPLGFIVYTPSQTSPPNTLDGFDTHSGEKYFASISSWDGPVNDWLISDELVNHPGGVFSFYLKSAADFLGPDAFKVGYSTTGTDPQDFILFNGGNTTTPSVNWTEYEYVIPANAKYLAINSVSQGYMMLVDDLQFSPNTEPLAPGAITQLTVEAQLGTEVEANLNWVNPTVDNAGNTLSNMTGVKIYRGTNPMNLTEIADLPSAAGQSMNYIDLLPEEGTYTHRFVPYNNAGNGIAYNTPSAFFGYETIPGAPVNITFTQDASSNTVISWDAVDYGANGGVLLDPVVGYTITRSLGGTTETLVEMHSATTFTEDNIPPLNLYTYSITAQTSAVNLGVSAIVSAYSGLRENQVSVTTGNTAASQPFELSRGSVISQSIYTPEEIGNSGLITSISYFGNLGTTTTARYKVYMSLSNRNTFGTTIYNAVWEHYGNQKLLFDGDVQFPAGRNEIAIDLDQPFYYDANSNQNVIITIIKPLLENPPSVNPRDFYNTPVDGMRTYYANGSTVDLSIVTSQPASWATSQIPTIPSIVVEKTTDYGSLSGTVTLLSNGSPLEDVTVTISPNGGGAYQTETTTTDVDGNYTIPALMAGDYVASFSKNTFNTLDIDFTIAPNEQLVLDAVLDNSLPIIISGTVIDEAGLGIEGVNLHLTGFSEFSIISDATGNYSLEAFADKQYDLEAVHPLYSTETISFTSEAADFTLDPITLNIATPKPGNVVAVNNNGVGEVNWRVPVGYSNETSIGWGDFVTAGDAWGNGGDPFIAGIRFLPSDLQNQVNPDAELTHVKAYIANNAEIIIKIFEGANGSELIHSQSASITTEGWYDFELSHTIAIDNTKELWIGIEFLAGQYGSYPIGLDDGPNAPAYKGSMKYENGVWTAMSLTNKNWNIYGITNNTTVANPSGYRVYRSPAAATTWTELTTAPITITTFNDPTLSSAAPDMYKYGISAEYGSSLVSEKGISNEIEHNMFFDFTLDLTTDSGSLEGAYISISNSDNFAEKTVAATPSVTFDHLLHGTYNIRIELDNYEIVELTDVVVEENGSITVPVNLNKVQPSNLTATIIGTDAAQLDWTLHSTYTDQMERYDDFERQNISDYILRDLDGLETYTYTNFTFPNAGDPMSFMVFNPYATSPPIEMEAVSGRRFLTGFAGPNGANNDWIIIPAGTGEFSFSAASLVGGTPENIRVLYSTTGTAISDFTAFGNQITVPAAWTQYSFDTPVDTKYVAINYVSNDSYIIRIDDIKFEREYNHALSYNIYLDGTLISEDVTETTFLLENLTQQGHIAEVEAVYESGVSEKTPVEIFMLGVEDQNLPEFLVYPNPTSGRFTLELPSRATVRIVDLNGRLLYSAVKEAGATMMEHNLSAGTYIIQVETEAGISTKKLLFL